MAESGERFGVVVADPPAFVKSRKELNSGLKGYRKLARLAATVVEPRGFLVVASCSHPVEPARFAEEVVAGMDRAGRKGRILRISGAGPDHPVHPHLPETAYLKTMVLQID
jgi:23S rRNA (cytosine1962-C5)-methyltransferase